jgi:hypothetical protein
LRLLIGATTDSRETGQKTAVLRKFGEMHGTYFGIVGVGAEMI